MAVGGRLPQSGRSRLPGVEPVGVAVVADEPDVGPDLVGVHRRPQHPQRLLQVAGLAEEPPAESDPIPGAQVGVMVASSSPGPVLAASAVNARRAWNGVGYWSRVTAPCWSWWMMKLPAGMGWSNASVSSCCSAGSTSSRLAANPSSSTSPTLSLPHPSWVTVCSSSANAGSGLCW